MKNLETLNYLLDSTDKKIIHLLTNNVKTSLAYIAENMGMSTTAIHQRIKRLVHAEIIDNSSSLLNPKKIGYNTISYIGVFLDQTSNYSDLIKSLNDINEVVEAHITTGYYTIFIKVVCKDNSHLMKIITKLQKLDLVARTETFISLEQCIFRQLKP